MPESLLRHSLTCLIEFVTISIKQVKGLMYMKYRFKLKKSDALRAKIEFTSNWIEAECFEVAVTVKDEFMRDHPEYWDCQFASWERKTGRGGKRIGAGSGGARVGAGRPRKYDSATKVVRVPEKMNVDQTIQSIESLESILKLWKQHAQTAKDESKTGQFPRTYDKALKLISELEEEITNLPFVV